MKSRKRFAIPRESLAWIPSRAPMILSRRWKQAARKIWQIWSSVPCRTWTEYGRPIRELSWMIDSQHQTLPRTPQSNLGALQCCLLYTSDAADDLLCVDLGGRRIIKKKKKN